MSDWQERITRETAPSIRAEHELRYRIAGPVIADSEVWADLGCGNGLAAAAALGAARPPKLVLVDIDEEVVARARDALAVEETTALVGDLGEPSCLERIGESVLNAKGKRVVTCFEVVEHLGSFVALLGWSAQLADEGAATFVLSVPNDAFWAIQNPHHRSSWGEGAFEELCHLLPREHTLLRQVALAGSAAVEWDGAPVRRELTVAAGGEGAVATHFIAAFGPRHRELWRGAFAVQADQLAQRRWERQRENDLAVMEKVAAAHDSQVEKLDREIIEQREKLRANTAEFDEWREYIHELERELGRPLAGSPEAPPPPEKHKQRSA
jgi:SAM-dependent methyltransferase